MKRTSCVTKTNVFVTSESNRFSLCIKLPRALVFSEIVHSWKHKGLESRKEGRSLDAPVRDRWLLGGVSLLTVLTTQLVLRFVYRHVRGSSLRGSSPRGASLLSASSLLGSSRPRISSLALSKKPFSSSRLLSGSLSDSLSDRPASCPAGGTSSAVFGGTSAALGGASSSSALGCCSSVRVKPSSSIRVAASK